MAKSPHVGVWILALLAIACCAVALRQIVAHDVATLIAWAWVSSMDVVMRLMAALFGI